MRRLIEALHTANKWIIPEFQYKPNDGWAKLSGKNPTEKDFPNNPSFYDDPKYKHAMQTLFDMKYLGKTIRVFRNFNDQYTSMDSTGKPPTEQMRKYNKRISNAIKAAVDHINSQV